MKACQSLLLFFLLLAGYYPAHAQNKNEESYNYTVIVLGKDNQPIREARITVGDNQLLTNNAGERRFYNKIYPSIKVDAPGYGSQKVDLRSYAKGKPITVFLTYIGEQAYQLVVTVKNENNRPINEAVVLVTPGTSAVTNASGKATTVHRQQPGEYIEVAVQAKGYKDQRQRVLVGMGQGTGLTRAADQAIFILEKGENKKMVFKINVEVLNKETDKPVAAADVKLQLSDGAELKAVSSAKGEAMFNDGSSYEGVTIRVMVTHPDYKESWSDIPQDLLMAENSDTRLFTVFLEPKAEAANWGGNWKYTDGKGTLTLSGTGSAVSGNCSYADGDWTSKNVISGCRLSANNTLTCSYTSNYEDPDKTVGSGGTVEFVLAGEQMGSVWKEKGPPKITWKPGRSQYSVTLWRDGQTWRNSFKR